MACRDDYHWRISTSIKNKYVSTHDTDNTVSSDLGLMNSLFIEISFQVQVHYQEKYEIRNILRGTDSSLYLNVQCPLPATKISALVSHTAKILQEPCLLVDKPHSWHVTPADCEV